ncbi:hypothetical protein Hypma_014467 [Hypsizygus marmoreus]|uniref:Uncharacterized protein n=1 Tax=Hypsizygus marmoreus TaxID=39966 RepID=A0A369JF91_HYPMA|nr:hypothetical protein Hypma_014467 [Hypsizygus marmoreus]
MVQKNVALAAAAAAAFVIGMSSVSAAPMAGHDNELYGRADKVVKAAAALAGKVVKDVAQGSLSDAANDKVKSWTQKETRPDPVAAAAIKKMNEPVNPALVNAVTNPPKRIPRPFNPAVVNAVVNPKKGQKKTRDLSDLYYEDLFTRAFEEELYARADKVVKAAGKLVGHVVKDTAAGALVDAANDNIKAATQKDKPLGPAADAAISKMTGPKNPALVNAAIGKKAPGPKKTRDLSDFEDELFTRAFEEELYARADKVIKAAGKLVGHVVKDTAAGALVDAANDKIKSATQKQKTLDPAAAAAINKMTGPFNPAAVQAAITKKAPAPKKTRDLSDFYDDDLFSRDFDEELYARADKIVKAVAKHVAKDAAHSTLVDAVTDKIKGATQKEQPLGAGASAAISKATGPFNPTLVNAAITKKPPPKKTRSLEEFLEARWFGLEDLD